MISQYSNFRVTMLSERNLEGYDEEQIRLMDEVCIVLDEQDMPIGSADKKTCEFLALFTCLA